MVGYRVVDVPRPYMMAKAATLDAPTRYSSVRPIGRSLISHKPSNAGKSRLVCGGFMLHAHSLPAQLGEALLAAIL